MTALRPIRLAYLVSHPIQYQAPLLRRIAREPGIDLHVMFGSDFSLGSYQDQGFGAAITWDVPLLEGYAHEFLPALRDRKAVTPTSPINRGIWRRLRGTRSIPPIDVLWVHGYHTVNSLHAMLAARALDIPVLVRSDSWLGDRPRSPVTLAAKQAFFSVLRTLVSGVLTAGTLNARYWTTYLGPGTPQFLMPYAVDNAFFQQHSRRAAENLEPLISELGLETARQTILYASKLQRRKRCSDLLLAYAQLCRDRRAAGRLEPHLLLVGDGEERAALEQQAAGLGLPHLRFCGFRNQSALPAFFALADVFVLPAQHEPWGLIINEVMNAACPVVISSDVGCQPDLVTDGVEGCVFPVGDVNALAGALHRVLDDPQTARAMGARALDRISSWSFEQDVQALHAALQQVTGRLPPPAHALP